MPRVRQSSRASGRNAPATGSAPTRSAAARSGAARERARTAAAERRENRNAPTGSLDDFIVRRERRRVPVIHLDVSDEEEEEESDTSETESETSGEEDDSDILSGEEIFDESQMDQSQEVDITLSSVNSRGSVLIDFSDDSSVSESSDEEDEEMEEGSSDSDDPIDVDDDEVPSLIEQSAAPPPPGPASAAAPSAADVPLDANVHECIICYAAITTEGVHRAVVLRCGHVFGKSCVEHWIQSSSKTCPSCKSKALLKDLRLIYARSLSAEDNSSLLEAQRKAANVTSENARLLVRIDELEKKLQNTAKGPSTSSGAGSTNAISVIRIFGDQKIRKSLSLTERGLVGSLDCGGQHSYTTAPGPGNLFKPMSLYRIDINGRVTHQIPCHTKKVRFVCVNPFDPDVVATASDDRTVVVSAFYGSEPAVKKTYSVAQMPYSLTWISNEIVAVGMSDGTVETFNWGLEGDVASNMFSFVSERVPINYCYFYANQNALAVVTSRRCCVCREGNKYALLEGNIRAFAFDKQNTSVVFGILERGKMCYSLYRIEFAGRDIRLVNALRIDMPTVSTRMMHGALFQNSAGGETLAVFDADNQRVYVRNILATGKAVHGSVLLPEKFECGQIVASPTIDENQVRKYRICLVTPAHYFQFHISC